MMWSKRFDVLGEQLNIACLRDMSWRLHLWCISQLHELSRHIEHMPDGCVEASTQELGDGEIRFTIPLSRFMPVQIVNEVEADPSNVPPESSAKGDAQ
jgi:hypothetical protein